jgi:hypothetical protein
MHKSLKQGWCQVSCSLCLIVCSVCVLLWLTNRESAFFWRIWNTGAYSVRYNDNLILIFSLLFVMPLMSPATEGVQRVKTFSVNHTHFSVLQICLCTLRYVFSIWDEHFTYMNYSPAPRCMKWNKVYIKNHLSSGYIAVFPTFPNI